MEFPVSRSDMHVHNSNTIKVGDNVCDTIANGRFDVFWTDIMLKSRSASILCTMVRPHYSSVQLTANSMRP